jgi:hypothetical protein
MVLSRGGQLEQWPSYSTIGCDPNKSIVHLDSQTGESGVDAHDSMQLRVALIKDNDNSVVQCDLQTSPMTYAVTRL